MTKMKPVSKRTPDLQYRQLLERIKNEGQRVKTQQEEDAYMVFGHQMRFPLENGFPMITERDLSGPFMEQAIGEHFAFLHGARTQAELEKFGCRWWKRWVTAEKCNKRGLEEGDLGPGSYGPAWRYFPTAEGKPFDQITHVIEQIKELPHLRTHIINPWIPQYIGRGEGKQQKVVVVPCHGFLHININGDELSVHHFQRSADVPVGLVFNMVQYALFTMMVAQVTGYKAKELVYTISDAHMFMQQEEAVAEMLSREPRVFPTVKLDPTITNIYDFRPEHVKVTDYNPHPAMRIGTPV